MAGRLTFPQSGVDPIKIAFSILWLPIVAALAASDIAELHSPAVPYDAPVLMHATSFGLDCGFCGNCVNPDRHKFTVHTEGPDRAYLESTHDCEDDFSTGTCTERHPESSYCEDETETFALLTPQEKEALWTVVTARPAEELPEVVEGLGGAVSFNADRGAIQVLACGGIVALNLPLSGEQVAVLEESP